MALWKNGAFVANEWRFVPDGEPLPKGISVLVTPERWEAEREDLRSRNAPIGLLLAPDAVWDDLSGDLPHFPVIAVSFPKFTDGRAFSIARLLRDRDGYTGEVRAVGDYFIDQVPLMRRVGIDAFETDDPTLKQALAASVWPEVPQHLQPAALDREVAAGRRPWARASAGR